MKSSIESKENTSLPIWKTVGKSYKVTWQYKHEYIKIFHPAILIYFSIIASIDYLTNQTICSSPATIEENTVLPEVLAVAAKDCVYFFVISLFAVKWHKLILLNNIFTYSFTYFNKDQLKYLIASLAIYSISFIAFFIIPIMKFLLPELIGIILTFISTLITYSYLLRITLILPAKALNMPNITIKEILSQTRANGAELIAVSFLCTIPFKATSIIIDKILNAKFTTKYMTSICQESLGKALIIDAKDFALTLIATPIALSLLSLSYQQLILSKEQEKSARIEQHDA